MPININITGLEDFTKKAKEAGKSLMNTPVPMGKTVIGTMAVIAIGEIILFRKMRFTLILTRKY